MGRVVTLGMTELVQNYNKYLFLFFEISLVRKTCYKRLNFIGL